MAKFAPRSIIITFFACFWLVTALTPAFGRGRQELGDLSRADRLIDDRDYDEAILFLTEFARRYPNQFEQAQERLSRIFKIRDEFNRIANLLIETLMDEDQVENSELILSLTTTLRTLEKENSPVLVNFLAQVHDIALFNVSRNQLRRALEDGRERLDRGDFDGALQAYAGGFAIMRDDFYAGNFSTAITSGTREQSDRVLSIISAFRQTSNRLEALTAELTRAVNQGQHDRVPEIMTRLEPVMDRYIEQKQSLYTAVNVFEEFLQDIQRNNPGIGDRNHLAFLIRVMHGRSDTGSPEGIFGTYDVFWQRTVGSSLSSISGYIETVNNTGLSSFNRRDFVSSANSLAPVEDYSEITATIFDKGRQLVPQNAVQTFSFNNVTILNQDTTQFLKLTSLNESSILLYQAARIVTREEVERDSLVRFQNRTITAPEAFAIEQHTRNTLTGRYQEIEELKTNAVQIDNQITVYENYPYIRNAISALDSLSNSLLADIQQSAQRYYTIAQHDLDYSLAVRKDQLQRAIVLMDGERRYPEEAILELSGMIELIQEDIERGNLLLAEIRAEPAGIASNAEIRNLQNRYQASVNELGSIRSQGTTLAETARSRIAQAEVFRQEGESLYYEAENFFQRQDYDAAIDRLERSSGRLDQSLALQESSEVREFRDTRLIALGQRIAAMINERIMNEVRELVNAARDFYFAGNFQRAEDNLTRARNRWRIVNLEENEEVEYWLSMIQRAMSASSARVILPTAPLYPEISQLLSQAQRNYEEGRQLINAGQRAQGLAKFDDARIQTREVKLMFPVNQEAGMLELRMEQFTDPRAFSESFEQRIRTAIAGTRPPARSLESYADLLNLAEINPGYPGLRAIINQAEIDMGIRPPPPNPADIARSRELTSSANYILTNNITGQFEIALTQINEAITLNPNNTDAPRIKDRLLNRMNTTQPSSAVLSSEDEALYQQAVRDFQAGNNLVAFANIERILQNPRNRNVQKVIDLHRRIQQAL